ncbi:MAG: terminase family protein [Planctomycetia bacterium]|nr:terminase family protein [Planctomycetia bacterium]
MDPQQTLALMLDPSLIFQAMGMTADPWQQELLLSTARQTLLNCSRQVGKSRTAAVLATHAVLFQPHSLVLLLSPSQRQSGEIFRKVMEAYNALQRPVKATYETQLKLELENGSRVVCLPGREETIRSFSGVRLLIIDEAARIPEDLYRSVRPMLAASQGRLLALSTPFGQRGWFHDEWHGDGQWYRVRIPWTQCPRITPEFMEEERRSMGDAWVRQEYECAFTAMEGLVYPDFEQCLVDLWPLPAGKAVGGIDFGWRNPFAALWGVLDRDDVLWIGRERYLRETPLHEHAQALPRHVMYYADPAGRTEIEELRASGLLVRKASNDIRLGIAAVTARIRTGRLKVLRTACPFLLSEAKLYRYPTVQERGTLGENPIDDHNHALGALRYLVSRIDAKFIAKLRKKATTDGPLEADFVEATLDPEETQRGVYGAKPYSPWTDEDLWTTL